jgi:hypothetical protein
VGTLTLSAAGFADGAAGSHERPMKPQPEQRPQGTDGLPKASDQLPEEAPSGLVADDVPEAGEGAARETAQRHARRVGRGEQRPGVRPGAGGRSGS